MPSRRRKRQTVGNDVESNAKKKTEVSLSPSVSTGDRFGWAAIKGVCVLWPVNVISDDNETAVIFLKSDDVIATSDILERTQIAKILMLQDQNRMGEFKDKSLEDIQLEDIVFRDVEREESEMPAVTPENHDTQDLFAPDVLEEAFGEAETFFDDMGERRGTKSRPTRRGEQRIRWTMEEEDEIKILFVKFFETKTKPKPAFCLKAIKRSRDRNGHIHKRKKDVLKKKVFRMIEKL